MAEDNYGDGENGGFSGMARWIPALVVLSALAGFITLGWYAYQAGTQSVSEDALLMVEADAGPMKEKPSDPGGMQFPNQDKMIFETFATDNKTPPKVEQILPAPEEPMEKPVDNTTSWVNKPEAEIVTGQEVILAPPPEEKQEFALDAAVDKKKEAQKTPDHITSYKQPKAKMVQAEEVKPVAVPSKSGKVKAQLGAYGSEKEAKAAWSGMQKKFGEALAGYGYMVARADLGAKGVFYRLRVTGFADTAAAKAFCGKLAAKGQACIPVSDK